MSLDNLYKLTNDRSRSISPENFTGEKGKGGMATMDEGIAASCARELGRGWKLNPFVRIEPGETFTMAEIDVPGIINHIWMTPVGDYRLNIFRFYWDDETEPSVEVPVGDFFASGWGWDSEPMINSAAVCVNPKNGFNCYWQMPFRKNCRITMENRSENQTTLYYQIDYTECETPPDAACFHASFRRENPLPLKKDFTIVDGIIGKGQYVGTYVAHGANSPRWWGEGEIKFFMDGDGEYPTICGTGEEDYFCGSYCYGMADDENKKEVYTDFSTLYAGFHHVKDPVHRRFGQYRWHIVDPIRFEKDLRVTLQSLGWQSEKRYLPLQDDLAAVAFWYQTEPHNPFPQLPENEKLVIQKEEPKE